MNVKYQETVCLRMLVLFYFVIHNIRKTSLKLIFRGFDSNLNINKDDKTHRRMQLFIEERKTLVRLNERGNIYEPLFPLNIYTRLSENTEQPTGA